MIVMFKNRDDAAIELQIKRALARRVKKDILKKCYAVTGYPFIDTDNPVFMRKLKLKLVPIVVKGRDMVEVYHSSLDYPIFRYTVTPFSTHTLHIHKNGTMTECEYPAVPFSNKESLDWKLFDLKIIRTAILPLEKTIIEIRRFYRDISRKWYNNSLNMIIPFIARKPEGVYVHMYGSRKANGLQKSAAIYDSKGRLFMFMGVDTLVANSEVIENYTEAEFFKAAVYLSIITDKTADIILTDGAYKVRTHESKIGYSELVSSIGMEYGVKYGETHILDTFEMPPEVLDFKNAMMKRKWVKRRGRH